MSRGKFMLDVFDMSEIEKQLLADAVEMEINSSAVHYLNMTVETHLLVEAQKIEDFKSVVGSIKELVLDVIQLNENKKEKIDEYHKVRREEQNDSTSEEMEKRVKKLQKCYDELKRAELKCEANKKEIDVKLLQLKTMASTLNHAKSAALKIITDIEDEL